MCMLYIIIVFALVQMQMYDININGCNEVQSLCPSSRTFQLNCTVNKTLLAAGNSLLALEWVIELNSTHTCKIVFNTKNGEVGVPRNCTKHHYISSNICTDIVCTAELLQNDTSFYYSTLTIDTLGVHSHNNHGITIRCLNPLGYDFDQCTTHLAGKLCTHTMDYL